MVPDPIGSYVTLANRNEPEAPNPMGLKLSNQLGLVASYGWGWGPQQGYSGSSGLTANSSLLGLWPQAASYTQET